MFSIIIPLYNKTAYITKTINSVLSQTFQEYELIIVNDGSTDDGLNKVMVYNDFRIKIIDQPNGGVSNARNNGVKAAKYDYISFLDADDWWNKDFLKELSLLISKYSEAAIYATNYYIVKNGVCKKAKIGVASGYTAGYINYFDVYAKTLCMPVWTGAVVIKKKTYIELNGFKDELKLGEDFDLWVRVALRYKIAFLNIPLSYYNQDVEIKNRGVVADKIYIKEEHIIFNLDYLSIEEKTNEPLKLLLDQLRVYTLLRYRLQNAYPNEVKSIISKVDFSTLGLKYRFYYICPVSVLKTYFDILKLGSKLKNAFKKTIK
jgi:glycosyltransferase involved in cell wall biosynthesis